MKTTIDARNEIYRLINVPRLRDLLSGGVYNGFRPENSAVEDVVVTAVTLSDGTLQNGVVNVNIYVPDLTLGWTRVPNTARLAEIKDVLIPLLREVHTPKYSVWVESTNDLTFPEISQHSLNIRLRIQFYNAK